MTTNDQGDGWSYVNRPVVDPFSTPIYQGLVEDVISWQANAHQEPNARHDPDDPLVGTP